MSDTVKAATGSATGELGAGEAVVCGPTSWLQLQSSECCLLCRWRMSARMICQQPNPLWRVDTQLQPRDLCLCSLLNACPCPGGHQRGRDADVQLDDSPDGSPVSDGALDFDQQVCVFDLDTCTCIEWRARLYLLHSTRVSVAQGKSPQDM